MKLSAKLLIALIILNVGLVYAENISSSGRYDNIKLIKAGSHTVQENEIHKSICQQYNATDVTDLSDIQLIGTTKDAVICFSANSQFPSAGSLTEQGLMLAGLRTIAPSATLNFAAYWINGEAIYSNGRVGSRLFMSVGVNVDNCGAAGEISIPQVSGSGFIQATCSYPTVRGRRQSYMQASLEGINSTSYGTITLN
jgi:hypothetical protein